MGKHEQAKTARPWHKRMLRILRGYFLNRFMVMVILPGIGLMTIWMRFVEANRLSVRLEKIPAATLGATKPARRLRVMHLTDLHLTSETAVLRLQDAIEKGLKEQPDVAVITGDTCLPPTEELQLAVESYFAYLRSVVPTFACIGNHDVAIDNPKRPPQRKAKTRPCERLLAIYGAAGIKVLRNQSAELIVNGTPIAMAGLDDLWTAHPKPQLCLRRKDDDQPRRLTLLLAHNPDALEECQLREYGWDVMFSGHTHGGQFRFPFTRWCPFAPVDHGEFAAKGLYDVGGGQWLSVSAGVGNYLEMRLNCLPEVTIVDVEP